MIILPESYRGKSIGVFGLGKSGNATLASLAASGVQVYAWDDKEASRTDAPKADIIHIMPYSEWPWEKLSAMILSPGIPLTHPAPHPSVVRAGQAGVRVTGDIALLADAYPLASYIGITGTNGKSTTTTLVGHLFKEAGTQCEVGGNLGTPVLSFAPLTKEEYYILEVSSYQLDLNPVRYHIAALLNITPDHLDRHGGMEGYIAAKEKIFAAQQTGDVAIIAVDDEYTQAMAVRVKNMNKATLVAVSASQNLADGITVQQGVLQEMVQGREVARIDLSGIASLTGQHNWQNAAIAYAIARAAGIPVAQIEKAMRSFPGLKHRMQLVATIDGVRFINDSKATNAEATVNALRPYDTIYWIIGGQAKAGGITSLAPYFHKIAHAFLIGEASGDFARTLDGTVPYTLCGTLDRAFDAASRMAFSEKKPDAVVLLSPACASWDQWKSFEHRGDAFCEMVSQLAVGS